jgi:hypothetical protein
VTGNVAIAKEPSRWKTILVDAVGFAAVIWVLPVAILVVGAPIALVVAGILWVLK